MHDGGGGDGRASIWNSKLTHCSSRQVQHLMKVAPGNICTVYRSC